MRTRNLRNLRNLAPEQKRKRRRIRRMRRIRMRKGRPASAEASQTLMAAQSPPLRPVAPENVPAMRWQQAVEDGRRFLARWGKQAEALGWTARDLFGLQTPPAKPHPSYSRLSRYDETGLIWLLQGREVAALTETTASIRSAAGNITIYRKHNKPALGHPGHPSVPAPAFLRVK
jgi:hypothetical protein